MSIVFCWSLFFLTPPPPLPPSLQYPDYLFEQETEQSSELCAILLRLCGSSLATTRSQASASLYMLMRHNYDLGQVCGRDTINLSTCLSGSESSSLVYLNPPPPPLSLSLSYLILSFLRPFVHLTSCVCFVYACVFVRPNSLHIKEIDMLHAQWAMLTKSVSRWHAVTVQLFFFPTFAELRSSKSPVYCGTVNTCGWQPGKHHALRL